MPGQLDDLKTSITSSEIASARPPEVADVLHRLRGPFNVSQAARLLGIDRATLYNKMRKYGIERTD